MQNYYENEFAIFWVEANILFFEYRPGTVIDLKAARIIVSDRLRMQDEKSYPILCDIRGIADSDKAARDYLAQQGSLLAKAVGIIAGKSLSLLMMSFYLKVSKPQVPTKVFSNKPEAMHFLQSYL
jgi:hypothetical protein